MRRAFLALLMGIGLGALGGALFGWFVPISPASAGLDKLNSDYKADYAVMVGASYSANGDWDLTQSRLGRLAEPDLPAYIVLLTEQYIAEGRNPEDIRHLARLAMRFGYVTSPMLPYLPATPAGNTP